MKGGDMDTTLAVRLPNGELSPIPQELVRLYNLKPNTLTPFTRLPIVEFIAIPLDEV